MSEGVKILFLKFYRLRLKILDKILYLLCQQQWLRIYLITKMIYTLSGKFILKQRDFIVIEVNGIGFRIFSPQSSLGQIKIGSKIKLFCHCHIQREGLDLYGFLKEKELELFLSLNKINGIGPKGALRILDSIGSKNLFTAINSGRADLLVKAAGIGQKKAHRIILELQEQAKKMGIGSSQLEKMESSQELEEILKNLGYKKQEIKKVISRLPPKIKKIEEQIKAALKILSR